MRSFLPILLAMVLVSGAVGCNGRSVAKEKETPLVAVQVMTIVPRSIAQVLNYDADVQGELEIKVFPLVSERILSLPVDEGDKVKKGQLLAVLRADALSEGVRSAIASVDAARADQNSIKDELNRSEKLLAKNIVSRAQVDQLQSRYLVAEAQVRRLEAMASQASTAHGNALVRSPIDGLVGRRFLSRGDLASPAIPILTVVRMEKVELQVEVPEKSLAVIREGMNAQIHVARYGQRPFVGQVTLIAPMIDRQTRTARVKVAVENTQHELMPGMLAQVSFEVQRHDNAIVVPYSSLIMETGAGEGVAYRGFVIQENKAKQRRVKIGIVEGSRVEVVQGLQPGELFVTKGQHLLDENREVSIVERREAPIASTATEANVAETAVKDQASSSGAHP
jgi:membrane fusion protein, multidrug efflux system